ncbi:hypothetical protein HY768_03105 [candidate division TA06 bacterium]|uniref:Uncharacterized protein n=1 Tax=candidate division TA06 bacterium TaxID=2250710 RepID=A0A933I810_UNCT6|nr:hypothetical protein [candidate division TA06 bacterium]
MAGNKSPNLGGMIMVLALSALLTVGAVLGVALATWPGSAAPAKPGAADPKLEMFAATASRLTGFIFFAYPDEVKDYLSPVLADLKTKLQPALKSITVTDPAGLIVGSDKEDQIDKTYQLPKGAMPPAGDKLEIQEIAPGQFLVAVPAIYNNKIKGGLRMLVELPQAKASSGGGNGMVIIIGLAAMLIGLIIPIAAVPAMTKQLSAVSAAPAGAGKAQAMKAEESSINTRLESLRRELGKAEELKAEQDQLTAEVESLRKQQFEEGYKLEGLKKEVTELGVQMEQRRQMLEATPDERQAQLTQEDRDLMQKIINHKKEELALAQKIQDIRRKVMELEKRTKA